MMDDLKERLRANGLDECDEAVAYIEELEQDVKAVQRREADANRAAMKHLRSLELERIKSANYAEFSNQWRRKCEALEARIAKADALEDGRPCATDVWLQSAFDHIDDHYDFREAVKAWLHGDWSGAMEWVEEYREGSDT